MRTALLVLPILAVARVPAAACPDPDAPSRCLMALDRVDHVVDLSYVVGTTAVGASGGGSRVDTAVGVDLGYTAQLGSDAQPEYELALTAGVTAHRIEGAVAANGIATRAALRLGPAPILTADTTDRYNTVWFPFAFELAHDGDLARVPGLSARPELARAVYGREHVSLATRLARVEVSGDDVPDTQHVGPGARTPQSYAFDIVPLYAELEATMQDGLRLETRFGGALIGAVGRRDGGATVELLGYEHREIRPPGRDATPIGTFWILRTEYANPATGTRYFLGWGTLAFVPDASELRRLLQERDPDADPDEDVFSVGGLGWWIDRRWGEIGFQYRRDPFITMAGEPAFEDRLFVEAIRPGRTRYTSRVFLARTLRLLVDGLREDVTTGVEVDAARTIRGFDVALHGELGRTFYAAVDNAAPEVGFAAQAALSISRRGARRWTR